MEDIHINAILGKIYMVDLIVLEDTWNQSFLELALERDRDG